MLQGAGGRWDSLQTNALARAQAQGVLLGLGRNPMRIEEPGALLGP